MRERADELKGQVRRMFEATMSMADAVTLVDTLEHLGIGLRFREEIDSLLGRVYRADEDLEFSASNDLHIVSLRFRLLRQHGFFVSADVFNKFRDGNNGGRFSTDLCGTKTRDLLSLYNAAHMAIPGEEALDDAIAFARRHLEAAVNKGELRSPMKEQVSRALDIPLPRFIARVETAYYIGEYEQEETHDAVLLELAKLDFNLVRALHLRELSDITLWWKALWAEVNLTFCRDRAVEMYFWTLDALPWDECSRARIVLAKVIGLATFMDDIYDVHASFEDCQRFDQAIQRWEESAASDVPEYLRALYVQTLSHFNEFEGLLKPHEKHRMAYLIQEYKMQSRLYLQEATWSYEKHMPTFKEHSDVAVMSSFVPTVCLVGLLFAEDDVATEQAVKWAFGMPYMYIASGEIGRFLNDVASYKMGKNKKDVASSVECYIKEHGVTGDEAVAAIAAMVELAWRRINQGCLEMRDRALQPAARSVVGVSTTLEVMYLGGRDGYTFGRDIKDLIVRLFIDPVPL
ncbi:hypothetical protein HU200_030092 [Digitaria exilis]|uniref:Terpene synthase n=1 Tax=Digitaria exilis TaxID=1010633 RepID=A0A835BPR8_9POAL|nr:hypothetical protein HU200_030092 [Digitaria exilis]